MTDGSDREGEDQSGNGGGASPRTLLAIRQALAEEEDDFMRGAVVTGDSPADEQIRARRPAPPVVVSSSEDEPEPESAKPSPLEDLSLDWNKANRSSRTTDGLSASSSEDEMDVVIARRSRDLQRALLEPRQQGELRSRDESNTGHLSGDMRRGGTDGRRDAGEKVTGSAPVCAQPQDASPGTTEAPEKPDGNLEASEESDSEGPTVFKFIPKRRRKSSVGIPGKLIILMIISTDAGVFPFQRASSRSQRKNLNRRKRFNLKPKREELQMMSKP